MMYLSRLLSTLLAISLFLFSSCTEDTAVSLDPEKDATLVDMQMSSKDQMQAQVDQMQEMIKDQTVAVIDQTLTVVDQALVDQALPIDQSLTVDQTLDSQINPIDQALEIDAMVVDQFVLQNTNPLLCADAYCPSSRLVSLNMPSNAVQAISAGCDVVGSHRGTSFSLIFSLLGTLEALFQPNQNGSIPLVIAAHLDGWQTGLTGNENEFVNLQFFKGFQTADPFTFQIDPTSYLNQDSNNGPLIHFDQTRIYNASLETSISTFKLALEIVAGLPFNLALDAAKITGDLSVDALGFNLRNGVLGGYMKTSDLQSFVNQLIDRCLLPNAPNFCGQLGFILNFQDPVASFNSILSLMGGADVYLDDQGNPSACMNNDQTCTANALSVCLQVEMNAITLQD